MRHGSLIFFLVIAIKSCKCYRCFIHTHQENGRADGNIKNKILSLTGEYDENIYEKQISIIMQMRITNEKIGFY